MKDIIKVKRAIRGEKEAFKELINEHYQYLYKIAYMHTKYEEDSKDIVQETVYKAYRSMKSLKDPSKFKTWITRILINESNTFLAKVGMIDLEDKEGYIKEDNKEIKIDMSKAIDLLEDKYKSVIILRYFYDLKVNDIAAQLDLNPNTVKTHIAKGLKEMKELLKEDYLNEEK